MDSQYSVWRQITQGMEHVDRIKKGSAAQNGAVDEPDIIVKMQDAADVEGAE